MSVRLDRLRRLCLALPETTEVEAWEDHPWDERVVKVGKKIFLFAIVVFLVGSVLCGISGSMAQLVAFRTVQGLGAGGLIALAQAIIADYWKKIGVRGNIKNLPNRLLNSADNRNRWPGAFIGSHNVTVEEWPERFHTKNIPTAENKYAPENVSGWNDPRKDAILDEINSIIPEKGSLSFSEMR